MQKKKEAKKGIDIREKSESLGTSPLESLGFD